MQIRRSNSILPALVTTGPRGRLGVAALLAVFMSVVFAGCANWNSPGPPAELKMPVNRMSPDSVSLELAIAELDADQAEDIENLWREVDQQKISLEARKLLDLNGLRCAVVPVRTPAALSRLVEPRAIDRESLQPYQQAMFDKGLLEPESRLISHNRIQNREGDHHSVQTSETYPELSWIVRDLESQAAGAGQNVRGEWRITTYPQSDGSVRIVLLPQVHHGIPRQQIGVKHKTFLFETAQSITPLNAMKIEASLVLGESMIIGAAPDLDGLGGIFFKVPVGREIETATPEVGLSFDEPDQSSEEIARSDLNEEVANQGVEQQRQRILLIRLVQTQKNDLFERRRMKEKLVSTIGD